MSTATLDISEARKELSRLDERLRKEQVIWVTRHNKKAFAVVDMEWMEALLETLDILRDPDAWKMLQESLCDIHAGRTISHEDLEAELKKVGNRERTARLDPLDGNSAQGSPGFAKRPRARTV